MVNVNSKNISFGNSTLTADQAKNLKALEEQKTKVAEFIAKTTKELKNAKSNMPPQELSGVMKQVSKVLKRVGSNKWLLKQIENNKIAKIVGLGNVGKELIGTTIYTVQALTNEDLPPDKRKFVGMYDLGVGLISTTLQFLIVIGLQDKLDKVVKKSIFKNKNSSRYGIAVAGTSLFVTSILQTILCKRIIAPSITTPIAGKYKAKFEAKEKAKKAAAEKSANVNETNASAQVVNTEQKKQEVKAVNNTVNVDNSAQTTSLLDTKNLFKKFN